MFAMVCIRLVNKFMSRLLGSYEVNLWYLGGITGHRSLYDGNNRVLYDGNNRVDVDFVGNRDRKYSIMSYVLSYNLLLLLLL